MKLKFDSSQEYQLSAIQSVIDIFEGQPLNKSDFEISFSKECSSLIFSEKGVANCLFLSAEQILSNITKIQSKNIIKESTKIEVCTYQTSYSETNTFPNHFTVEMETGTGKTYTYLRTIYELNKVYGFKKYVIVVPSVAIKEGVIKNLEITHEHFQNLYGNPPVNFSMYDSSKTGILRNFATSNAIQILVITIDSFAKDSNIINSTQETGIKPIEYIQSTNPIVIADEPQNMETNIRKAAIHNLNPLCTLRYSATHKNFYNLVYSLNPVHAYDLGLVKQIEVDGIVAETNYNTAFIHFMGILQSKKNIKVKLAIFANEKGRAIQKIINVEIQDDLYLLSNHRETYQNGFVLNSINAETKTIEFSNGLCMQVGQQHASANNEIMKYQIERTIKWHFEKEKDYKEKGIKVLSLFFVDKVENYRIYNNEGKPEKGKFAKWFEEICTQYLPEKYPYPVEKLHDGYFSQDKGKYKDTKGNTNADGDTYALIMKDKEKLLSEDEPLRFIFSHSALREGWDNPNVFQICTLNESKSEIRKRQEIGRGLRLPVNKYGQRIWDNTVNLLTVIANESYSDFSMQLQKEIEEETSVDFSGRIKNAKERINKSYEKSGIPLKTNTQVQKYPVKYWNAEKFEKVIAEIKKMPKTLHPKLIAEKQKINIGHYNLNGKITEKQEQEFFLAAYSIPDIYTYIQAHIAITRTSIFKILKHSGRIDELLVNPQLFLDNVVQSMKNVLAN